MRAVEFVEIAALVVVAFVGFLEVLNSAAKKAVDLKRTLQKLFGRSQLRR